jgi:SAM-dependent methyltransferase
MLCCPVRERCGQVVIGRVVPSGRYRAYRSPRSDLESDAEYASAGRGGRKRASAAFLAARFGCEVVGIDYSGKNVEEAVRNANDMGLSERVFFRQGDAECLPFADRSFDAIVCECAFCTFPNKQAAAKEFARVLRKGAKNCSGTELTAMLPLHTGP